MHVIFYISDNNKISFLEYLKELEKILYKDINENELLVLKNITLIKFWIIRTINDRKDYNFYKKNNMLARYNINIGIQFIENKALGYNFLLKQGLHNKLKSVNTHLFKGNIFHFLIFIKNENELKQFYKFIPSEKVDFFEKFFKGTVGHMHLVFFDKKSGDAHIHALASNKGNSIFPNRVIEFSSLYI